MKRPAGQQDRQGRASAVRRVDSDHLPPGDAAAPDHVHRGRQQVEGNTYGNTGERYEAAVALRPELDEKTGKVRVRRYLVDTTKPEIAIRVSDLAYSPGT